MKVDLLILHLDNTITKKRCKVDEGRIQIPKGFLGLMGRKTWKPKITAGQSVFPERSTSIWQRLGFKRKHRFVMAIEGAPHCFDLDPRDGFLDDHWTFGEARKFIAKLVSLAASKQKMFSNWQVLLLFGGLMGVIVLNFFIARRLGIL